MRPDMDDYAEIDESQPTGGSRAMSWMVLAVAVGGFAALAFYAYNSGNKTAAGDETMMVEADASPIKEAPANPDGEEFPNKDKTIYDVISPNGEAKTGEKLLPDPEHPVAAANVEDSEDDVPATAPATAAASVAAVATPAPAPVAAPAAGPAPAAAASTTTFVASSTSPAPVVAKEVAPQTVSEQPVATVAKPAEKSFASPEMVNEKTLTGKKEEAAKPVAAAKEKPKAEAKPKAEKPAAVKEAAGGAYKVQLGAFKSEEEALGAWKKISGAHSAVLGGSPTIVKAEVNGGTFYRLRAGSYASADAAKAACAKLGGQACFPVK